MHVEAVFDTLVVGGGLTGMSAALLCAQKGRKTLILEQGPLLAPLGRGFEQDGAYFDTGFTYAGALGPGETLNKMLQRLGLCNLVFEPVHAEGYDRFYFIEDGFSYEFVTKNLPEQLKSCSPTKPPH